MTSLSFIEAEARRLAGRRAEPARRAIQEALIELCEKHWQEIRGPEPAAPLAHALWSARPPLAELFVDLLAAADARLTALLDRLRPARALALLVLAEIERGDAEGVRTAYEAMMLFESPAAGQAYARRIVAALRGEVEGPRLHSHSSRTPLWKALAIIAAQTRRHNLGVLVEVIRTLAATPGVRPDEALERLRRALREAGMRFLGIDDQVLRYELHGRERKPVSRKRLAEVLAEIRQARLA